MRRAPSSSLRGRCLVAAPPAPGAPAGLLPATVPPPIVVTSTADRTTAGVGERVTVVYSARIPEGATLQLDALVSPARPEGQSATAGFVLDFEPVEPARRREGEGGTGLVDVRQTVRLAAFVPGEIARPRPRLLLRGPGRDEGRRPPARRSRSPSPRACPSRPGPRAARAEAGAPRADPGEEPLVLGVDRRRRPRRRRPRLLAREAAEEEGTARPERAPRRLRRPTSSWRPRSPSSPRRAASLDGDPRPFYTDLTHAAKRFLERHLEQPVLEWTTFETVRRLREAGAEPPREVALPELLPGRRQGEVRPGRLDARGRASGRSRAPGTSWRGDA